MFNEIVGDFMQVIRLMCYPFNKALAFADAFTGKHKQKLGGLGIVAIGALLFSGNFADPPMPVWAIVGCSVMPLTMMAFGIRVIAGKERLR